MPYKKTVPTKSNLPAVVRYPIPAPQRPQPVRSNTGRKQHCPICHDYKQNSGPKAGHECGIKCESYETCPTKYLVGMSCVL